MLQRIFALALGLALGAPVLAADTISATHVFPASLIYSRSFLEYVKKANAISPPTRGRPMKVIRRAIRTGDRTVTLGPKPFLFFGLWSRYGPRRNA